MSLASLSPQLAGSAQSSSTNSPIYSGRPPPFGVIDPQELEQRLRKFARGVTLPVEDRAENLKADAERDRKQLIELGGRPTRPIKAHVDWKGALGDAGNHYRNDYERKDVLVREEMISEDARWVAAHWAQESSMWMSELHEWQSFKQAQQIYHQGERSELDLELDNADVALVEALSKLNDWQEFQFDHQKDFDHAEWLHGVAQQGIARIHDAMAVSSSADPILEFEEPFSRFMSYTVLWPKQLKTFQRKLMWVKSQWPEAIAEACSLVAVAPKLQEQLEAKVETQTKAIYRTLQQMRARPRHAIFTPNPNADLAQRIQHWLSQGSALNAELKDWKIFMEWRRLIRDSGNRSQKGGKVLSEGDSDTELFEDFVKYQQYELAKVASCVKYWRLPERQRREAHICVFPKSPLKLYNNTGHLTTDTSTMGKNEIPEENRAETYAVQAEEQLSVLEKRLEESKQKLRGILADTGPHCTSEIPAALAGIEKPPTPPRSPDLEGLRKGRRPSEQRGSGGKGHRRSKKEKARKGRGNVVNTNTEQHALPTSSLNLIHLEEDDVDIEMSDDAENSWPIEIKKELNQEDLEETVMSDVEESPTETPISPPQSQPETTSHTKKRKLPPPSSQPLKPRKTRSATKPDQISSGKIHKKPNKNKVPKTGKDFSEQQKGVLLDAVSNDYPSIAPTTLGRTEPESCLTPATNNNYDTLPSLGSSAPSLRKTVQPPKIDRSPSGKILKKPNKNKPRKKMKNFTEEQEQALLDAASANCPLTGPTSLGNPEWKPYPNPPTSTDSDASPSPSATRSDSKINQPPSTDVYKNSNENKRRKKVGNSTEEQTKTVVDAALTGPSQPRRSERLREKAAADKWRE